MGTHHTKSMHQSKSMHHSNYKTYYPFIGPFDPCPPIRVKTFVTPPNLYMNFQPMNLPQFSPAEALMRGTLWPALFSSYESKSSMEMRNEDEGSREGG